MEILFFNERSKRFHKSLNNDLKSKADRLLELLEEHGNNLTMPFSKPIGRKLFELRIVGENHVRFIYAFHIDKAWILHGFFKKADKIPKIEIDYAVKQFKLLLHWYNG